MHYALTIWLTSVLAVMSPPERDAKLARGTETSEQRTQRYDGIAYDIATAVEGHALPGTTERQTAALLAAVTFYESSFAPDVDDGTCNENVTYNPKKRCDGGSSVGLMQLHFGKGQTSFMGKTFDELRGISNRTANLSTGLAAIRVGVASCAREWRRQKSSKPKVEDMLAAGLAWYARGSCNSVSGLKDGEKKVKLMTRVLADKRFPRFDPSVTQPNGEVD